jgi:hypothetical protein
MQQYIKKLELSKEPNEAEIANANEVVIVARRTLNKIDSMLRVVPTTEMSEKKIQ